MLLPFEVIDRIFSYNKYTDSLESFIACSGYLINKEFTELFYIRTFAVINENELNRISRMDSTVVQKYCGLALELNLAYEVPEFVFELNFTNCTKLSLVELDNMVLLDWVSKIRFPSLQHLLYCNSNAAVRKDLEFIKILTDIKVTLWVNENTFPYDYSSILPMVKEIVIDSGYASQFWLNQLNACFPNIMDLELECVENDEVMDLSVFKKVEIINFPEIPCPVIFPRHLKGFNCSVSDYTNSKPIQLPLEITDCCEFVVDVSGIPLLKELVPMLRKSCKKYRMTCISSFLVTNFTNYNNCKLEYKRFKHEFVFILDKFHKINRTHLDYFGPEIASYLLT